MTTYQHYAYYIRISGRSWIITHICCRHFNQQLYSKCYDEILLTQAARCSPSTTNGHIQTRAAFPLLLMNYLSACVVANFILIMTFADAHLAWMQLHKVTMEQFVSVWLNKAEVAVFSRCALESTSLLEVLSLNIPTSLNLTFLVMAASVIGISVFPK